MIFICILSGMLLKSTRSIHPDAHKGINTWIIYVGFPAVSFKYLPQVVWSNEMILPAVSSIVVTLGSLIFVKAYCLYKGYSKRTQGSLEITTGFSNTSFIGFPLIIAYYGEQYIKVGIISDQMNFLLLSVVGIISAVKGGNDGASIPAKFIFKRLITFPPFIGSMMALILSQLIDLSPAEPLFDKLASTVAPMALFSIGLQLKFNGWRKEISQISAALLYKLMLAPALVLIIALIFRQYGYSAKVSVLQAAMPTLVTSSMIAEQFKLNTCITNLIIGIGIIMGFVTTAFWYQIMEILL